MSTREKDGGPAFPHETLERIASGLTSNSYIEARRTHGGMSLRDWLAGQALAAIVRKRMIADADEDRDAEKATHISEKAAAGAYLYADAMLAEREK